MTVARQLLKSLLTAVLPSEKWLVRCPRGLLTDTPTLFLTFDDGPHPEHTPRVLDELARWKLSATFFVVGREADRHPQILRRIVDDGHSLGNHTFTHSEPSQTSTAQFLDEVRRTNELLSLWTDQPCQWLRPPKGELTWGKLRGVWRLRQTVVLWNVDPRDYRMLSAGDVTAWCQSYLPQHGDIVLLHDNHRWAADIIAELGRRGLWHNWHCAGLDTWRGGRTSSTANPVGLQRRHGVLRSACAAKV